MVLSMEALHLRRLSNVNVSLNPFNPLSASIFVITLVRQHDCTVELIRQSAMATPNHHGADDELAEGRKVTTEGGEVSWVTEGEADIAARAR
jgi:hypothetical protein